MVSLLVEWEVEVSRDCSCHCLLAYLFRLLFHVVSSLTSLFYPSLRFCSFTKSKGQLMYCQLLAVMILLFPFIIDVSMGHLLLVLQYPDLVKVLKIYSSVDHTFVLLRAF